jgi:glutathione synthase/RimK-type ligase-like ATP-grasp enzyme
MKVQILTPAADNARFAASWPDYFAVLTAPLVATGCEVAPRPWTEPIDPEGADLILPLLAWGYHLKAQLWAQRLLDLAAAPVPVLNSPAVLTWNTSKLYLTQLTAAGAPVVPTWAVDVATPEAVEAARAAFGVKTVVVKPQISAGSQATLKVGPGGSLQDGPTGPALIQPFLPAVAGEGELSLFYFGGVYSHAVAKVATGGDFRVQPQFGGAVRAIEPPAEAFAAAEAVLRLAPLGQLYMRVDLLRGPDGQLLLMELEAIEPDLYLGYAADGGARFAAAVLGVTG